MDQPQYFEVLKQDDKSTGQQFYSNVEDQTVQYVITPSKTQVQYPTTPIVVASGEQLMVVNGPPQQIVINQTSMNYQDSQVQQQLQQARAQTRPSLRMLNQNQAVRQVTSVLQQRTSLPPPLQSIPSQSQMRTSNGNQIQLNLRQQHPLARSVASPQQLNSLKPQNPNQQQQLRQPAPVQQMRQPVAGQQLRISNPTLQQRINIQLKNATMMNTSRLQELTQQHQQLQVANSQRSDGDSMDINSSDDQEAITLPGGSVVSAAVYKKMLAEHKTTNVTQRVQSTQQSEQSTQATQETSLNQTPTAKKRTPAARNPRQPPRGGVRSTGKGRTQAQKTALNSTQAKDTPELTMMNQQQNKPAPYQNPIQNHPGLQTPQNQMIQQDQLQNQAQQQLQQQIQQQQQQLLQQQQQYSRPSQANYVIQPPKYNQKPQPQRPLPAYIPSSQIQKIIESTPISEEFSDSIRMLVLLENGEQRLITFTLPKEACTIQEILEQVNVPFQNNTNIQVTEANSNGINYIVTVGNVPPLGYEEEESHSQSQESSPSSEAVVTTSQQQFQQEQQPQEQHQQQQPLEQQQAQQQQQQPQHSSPCPSPSPVGAQSLPEQQQTSSPEPAKEIPKLVHGMLALCGACGYLSEDFARCIRCQRKLPDNVKSIAAAIRGTNGQKKNSSLCQLQNQQQQSKSNPVSPIKKKPTKMNKTSEQDSVVISSDEEGEEKSSGLSENILQKLGNSVTISPVTKEPSSNDIQRHCSLRPNNIDQSETLIVKTTLKCRTVRIGSYRCVPIEEVIIDSLQVIIKVPHPKDKEIKTVVFEKCDIVKVLASFNSSLPVIFYYLNPGAAEKIREELGMSAADSDYCFDPLSSDDESQRRVTLLPDDIEENDRNVFQLIYANPTNILEELNVKEANDILIKTCPKELAKNAIGFGTFTEIKQLLTYPPEGRGRISINTEDYLCLGQDQFLNDVIIDFYLKYLVEHLPSNQKSKVHVFSTFFYKRLTTKPLKASRKSQPTELDPTLTSAQKRHARVKTWTKNVNLFEKDFVIVPINENAHWFLAIICFPGMDGCHTWDGKPYKLEVKSRSKKKVAVATIGNVSVTAVKQEKIAKPILCEDPDLSDKDEAEGDESELESDDSEELPLPQINQDLPIATPSPKVSKEPRPPIKQPCILIFDSLAGASRSRVVATLRDYLTCEHNVKLGKEKVFNKNVIKGASPKVPQQNNFTDCGLYVLQYVEQFFEDPIKDYNIPIKEIKDWFEELTVTKKREDIALLIKSLMKEYGKNTRLLPEIAFPTINGKIVEREPDEEDEEMMEEDQSFGEDDVKNESLSTIDSCDKSESFSEAASSTEDVASPIKPSNESVPSDFITQTVLNPKPDLSEFPRQTNKDTLSYLKAKRIIRHKNVDGPDMKKLKTDQ